MSGHTPGPWAVGKPDGQSVEINTGTEPRLFYDSWKGMAIVHGCNDEPETGSDVMLANARLIAAAPDLLKALQELTDELIHHMVDSGGLVQVQNARAAIGKATGAA